MEKTIKTMLALMAGALTFSACSSDEFATTENQNNGAKLVTLTAYQEGDDATSRAAIDGTTSTQIDWTTGDKINYFGNGTGESMTLSGGEGTATGSFTGTVTAGTTDYVLYPYQESATCSNGTITATIPAEQTATANTFDPAAALMVGTVSGSSITFKNVCSFLKFTTAQDYTKVVISVTSGNIAGTFDITSSDGTATAKTGVKSITLKPASGSTTIAAGVYYVAIAPGTDLSGFKLECYTDASTHVDKSKTGNSTFARNKVYKLGVTEAITGTAKATINSSEVDIDWVQLWPGGPKFARRNVDATGSSDKESTKGTTMSYTDAAKTGSDYVWGTNWKTPSKDEMDLLNTAKVTCSYTTQDEVYGFKFTGVQDGYTSSSLFLPADYGDSDYGYVSYWSSSASGSVAWFLNLSYYYGEYESDWYSNSQSNRHYVRPVLK